MLGVGVGRWGWMAHACAYMCEYVHVCVYMYIYVCLCVLSRFSECVYYVDHPLYVLVWVSQHELEVMLSRVLP